MAEASKEELKSTLELVHVVEDICGRDILTSLVVGAAALTVIVAAVILPEASLSKEIAALGINAPDLLSELFKGASGAGSSSAGLMAIYKLRGEYRERSKVQLIGMWLDKNPSQENVVWVRQELQRFLKFTPETKKHD